VSYLLDTNVVSEWTRPRPNAGVVEWLAKVDEDEVFLSVVTFAELRHGIERLAPGARRRRLDEWLRNACRRDSKVESPESMERSPMSGDGWWPVARRADAPFTPWMRSLPPLRRSMA